MGVDIQLKGLRALVTGGIKGVGEATVQTLLADGAQVLTVARNAPENPNGADFLAADATTLTSAISLPRPSRRAWAGSTSSCTT